MNHLRFVAALAILAVGSLLSPRAAHALPKFAQAEGKPCLYCHTAPIGNANNLNYRAKFYKAHNFSFTGFDDAAEAKKAGVEVGPEAVPPPKSLKPAVAEAPVKPDAGSPSGTAKSLLASTSVLGAWQRNAVSPAEATFTQDGNAIRVNITSKGDAVWQVQLTQTLSGKGSDGLEEGREYLLHFRAKANEKRGLLVRPQANKEPDYPSVGVEKP